MWSYIHLYYGVHCHDQPGSCPLRNGRQDRVEREEFEDGNVMEKAVTPRDLLPWQEAGRPNVASLIEHGDLQPSG